MFYHGFTLSRYRSLGFGSNNANIVALFGLAFAMASSPPFERRLNRACTINSPDHSSTGTTSSIPQSCERGIALRLLVNIWFQVLFHSPSGVLFTFPSRYLFTIGRQRVFSLGGWSPRLPARFHVSGSTLDTIKSPIRFAYGIVTLFDRPFHAVQLRSD